MEESRLNQLASLAGAISPQVGLIASLLVGVIGGRKKGMHKDARAVLEWIEDRSTKLLEELVTTNPSRSRQRELEIRLHETLDILLDVQKEKPWD